MKGNVSNDDVLAFYKRYHVDLFVSLSESEGIPVSMMEAISFGIPVLACDLNGIPEIVNDITGKLIPVHAGIDEILLEVEQILLQKQFDRRGIYQYYRQEFHAGHNYRQFVDEIQQFFDIPPLNENSVDVTH
jgi:glycosyltransferase involved in cell wall biosynthesis